MLCKHYINIKNVELIKVQFEKKSRNPLQFTVQENNFCTFQVSPSVLLLRIWIPLNLYYLLPFIPGSLILSDYFHCFSIILKLLKILLCLIISMYLICKMNFALSGQTLESSLQLLIMPWKCLLDNTLVLINILIGHQDVACWFKLFDS